ncbi:rCG44512 [Rattus norvegicus]|uniref:RCG44512 n=1 Tax=Rattus norvegicus TaxID=10116 RepID=A6I4U5_RAT|nr:rCG44512 [Rattus norvegicus]
MLAHLPLYAFIKLCVTQFPCDLELAIT